MIYRLGGELLAEKASGAAPASPQKEYGYRGGQLLVTAAPGADVRWLVADQLGTPRIIADRTGSLAGIRRHDYLPFGEELGLVGGRTEGQKYAVDNVSQKFTGYERDNETGLDYAQARYYSSTQGRFTGPDPLLDSAEPEQPQTWNRYTYVLNNPLNFVDPDGLRYVQRTLANGDIQFAWCPTDECYNHAIDKKSKDYAGWTAVTFDESKPFQYVCICGSGGDKYGAYRLNPDGTHGYTDVLDGNYHAMSTDWNAQLAIGGLLKSLFQGLGRLLARQAITESTEGAAATVATQTAESTATTQSAEAVGGKITGFTRHGLNQAISRDGVAFQQGRLEMRLLTLSK